MWKKMLGRPSTSTDLLYYSEPKQHDARSHVYTSQLLREEVPPTRPQDSDWDTGPSSLGSGDTGVRCVCSTAPIVYYHRWPMVSLRESSTCFVADTDTAGNRANPLENCIPTDFDNSISASYGVKLYFYTNGGRIYDGTGDWVVDYDAGVLTFYDDTQISGSVARDKPPYISFYAYTGKTGLHWHDTLNGPEGIRTTEPVLIAADGGLTQLSSNVGLEVELPALFHSKITATEVDAVSDIALKKDVETIDGALGRLDKLRGVRFRWKRTNSTSYGIIAQELERALPGSTGNFKDEGGTDRMSANYNAVIGLLVESVKAQEKRIKKLEKQLLGCSTKFGR